MKTIVLYGNPHPHRNSATLTENFLRGFNTNDFSCGGGMVNFYMRLAWWSQTKPIPNCLRSDPKIFTFSKQSLEAILQWPQDKTEA